MTPVYKFVVRHLDGFTCPEILLVVKEAVIASEECRLHHQLFRMESFAKSRHSFSLDWAQHHRVDGDVILGQQNGSSRLRPHGRRCLGRAILRESLACVYT